ncbi:1,4-alpha-glucan branching protein GlgB [Segetibacter sp. 3557_3]|uniref:1,4-alpha-glucan branching protein GlgB n=1 Tax=Segetibacter sp. 3557_3 TaxID=2547429 RepID=UPI0010589D3F|nr:1,4-alpha-glucan branching protein GlgB [Segetibacter sp. 3557_3]TDH26516.1 1,4-alpha-glucan branching protein GlgB [Segetibacter sp. 3557_3]
MAVRKSTDNVNLDQDERKEKDRQKKDASRSKRIKSAIPAERKKYEELYFVNATQPVWNYSLFSDEDVRNFQNGTHYSMYNFLGNKQLEVLDTKGTYFAVWAPNATFVSVIGHFNHWDKTSHPLHVRTDNSGIWEGFIPHVHTGEAYKYHIHGFNGALLDKGDPYAHYWEHRPHTASITWATNYEWKDSKWMKRRAENNALSAPFSVYEVHLASWMRPDKNDEERYNSYGQITELLVPYVKDLGFTHVEFMPVMEHPFDGSWGYQGTGFFAPTSRFGSPQEFAQMVDAFHQAGIGVILDWVPSHFPYDAHGLFMFDGTHTYEYADMRKGFHPDWNSYIFNYKRGEVKSFLISSARFWFERFHIDGIRVDAVSSMLRLDYSRNAGEWEPNEFGGNGNLEAIAFIKDLNETIYRDFPDVQTIAEESTDWPGITRPTFSDGLGFGMKWMMGWMHDTLDYFKMDPYFRQFHQDKFTFSMMYFNDENFMLPLSHDEVVHGKSPMIYKMPGDTWQKFANLRLMYTYMFTHPGAKLLFMGNEFGQTSEWNYRSELQWDLLQHDSHKLLQHCVRDLNMLYRKLPALHEKQFGPEGFEWVDLNHRQESIMVYKRKGLKQRDDVLIILNMTAIPRFDFEIEVGEKKRWKEVFNSDSKSYWGSGDVYNPDINAELINKKEDRYKLRLHLPPLGAVVLS